MNSHPIPIFFACDDQFAKFAVVSIYSLIRNTSRDRNYHIHVLHTDISGEMRDTILKLQQPHVEISFHNVSSYLDSVSEKLPLRDYYSKTTYFRFFIAEMFPQYDKAVYVDADTIIQGDMGKLYDIEPGDAYVGACHEQVMVQEEVFGTYVEKVLGVSRHNFFNAGVLLINCRAFREHRVLNRFVEELHYYNFAVTQDEDYLNLICKDHVLWLDQRWNTEVFGDIPYPVDQAHILHYIMTSKPWHYRDCRYSEQYWHYARQTEVFQQIQEILFAYSAEEKKRDQISGEKLRQLAIAETLREDNYLNRINREKRAQDRVAIQEKIQRYEREGRFGEDVEEDPPSKVLEPEQIDYLHKTLLQRIQTTFSFAMARRLVNQLLRQKKMIIKEIRGIENFQGLQSGAVITCNHFNAFDSFAIQLAYDGARQPRRRFYRVIREGNYTSFPGFYGMLMRHCNTLPLSSNMATMKKFMNAVNTLLQQGHFILIYPEQSMWWNYRKPKPLKKGAFTIAAKNNVPVLPCFITMKDSDILGEDGFFVQEYTIHIGKPIVPDGSLPYLQRSNAMLEQNYDLWKKIYEKEYEIPLSYTTEAAGTENGIA